MKKIGNLFELAENQLIKEQKEKIIPCYTLIDVIEYAILIRKWLDYNSNKIKQVMKLSKEELRIKHNKGRRNYYLKSGK